jgi:threonine dehydratase
VVAGSAGNHAQSLAYAARARGLACEVFMPAEASLAKVAAVRGFGGTVQLGGDSVDDCVARARERARETGAVFVHPFDDPEIVAGQATLGLELLDDVDDIATVVVPVGGGGLISGVAGAVKAARPGVRMIGVQAEACSAYPASLERGEPVEIPGGPTIADGIAIKRPGGLTLPLVREWVDELVVVADNDVAEAMVVLLERAKLVVEGAGAVGVAALLSGAIVPARQGATVVVLSGGNVDAGVLATVALRHETAEGRRLRFFTRVEDRPGGLARLLTRIAEAGGNLVTVTHVREAVPLHLRQTGVDLLLETRGADHAAEIVAALEQAGYGIELPTEGAAPRPVASAADRLEPPTAGGGG